jgi:hypothetical protein
MRSSKLARYESPPSSDRKGAFMGKNTMSKLRFRPGCAIIQKICRLLLCGRTQSSYGKCQWWQILDWKAISRILVILISSGFVNYVNKDEQTVINPHTAMASRVRSKARPCVTKRWCPNSSVLATATTMARRMRTSAPRRKRTTATSSTAAWHGWRCAPRAAPRKSLASKRRSPPPRPAGCSRHNSSTPTPLPIR